MKIILTWCFSWVREQAFFLWPFSWSFMLFWLLPVIQAKQPKDEPSGLVLHHLLLAAERFEVMGCIWGREHEGLEGNRLHRAENWVMGPDDTKVPCAEVVVNYLYWEAAGLLPWELHASLSPGFCRPLTQPSTWLGDICPALILPPFYHVFILKIGGGGGHSSSQLAATWGQTEYDNLRSAHRSPGKNCVIKILR